MKHTTRTVTLALLLYSAPGLFAAAAAPARDLYAGERAHISAVMKDTHVHHNFLGTVEDLALHPLIAHEEYYRLTEDERELFLRRLFAEYDQLKHVGAMHGFLTTIIGLSESAASKVIDRVRHSGVSVLNRVVTPLLKKLVISNAPRGGGFSVYTDAQELTHNDFDHHALPTDEEAQKNDMLDNNISLLDKALLRGVDGVVAAGSGGKRLYEAVSPTVRRAYASANSFGLWLRSWLHEQLGTTPLKESDSYKKAAATS